MAGDVFMSFVPYSLLYCTYSVVKSCFTMYVERNTAVSVNTVVVQ